NVIPEYILPGPGKNQRVAGGKVAGFEGYNLSVVRGVPNHVERFHEGIRVEAGIAGIIAPRLAAGAAHACRRRNVVEEPVRRVEFRWVVRLGNGKKVLADVLRTIDVDFPDDEPSVRPHEVVKNAGG